ncbi:MAG TPA: 5'/3'-nucleotidase SurE [Candidatus Limnocylindria bacterium]|nr:5'/3'-nucleotidase SurE [Candidatus Limnocylindria bacterium]
MHLLITNDDGVYAPGILTLARTAAQAGHSVVVSAPHTQQSATGHRLTISESLMVTEKDLDPRFEAFAVSGSPVDCVRIGRRLSDQPFDFCLSGINDGVNAGTDLYYSGTAAAAREAAMLYLPSMAISIGTGADEDMRQMVAEQALQIMDYIVTHPMPRLTFCNLNMPALARGKVKPVRIAPMSQGFYLDEYVERVNPRGQRYFWIEDGVVVEPPEEGTDVQLLKEGHMTVTFVGGFRDNNLMYYPKLETVLHG